MTPCQDGKACIWARECGTKLFCPFTECVLAPICDHCAYDRIRRKVVNLVDVRRKVMVDSED